MENHGSDWLIFCSCNILANSERSPDSTRRRHWRCIEFEANDVTPLQDENHNAHLSFWSPTLSSSLLKNGFLRFLGNVKPTLLLCSILLYYNPQWEITAVLGWAKALLTSIWQALQQQALSYHSGFHVFSYFVLKFRRNVHNLSWRSMMRFLA